MKSFNTLYKPQDLEGLTHYIQLKEMIPYVFLDDESSENSFRIQLKSLIDIKHHLDQWQSGKYNFCFICKEPGAGNSHFIVGILSGNNLIIINPVGHTHHKGFYQNLKYFLQKILELNLCISNTTIQQDQEGLSSCGPICGEIMKYICGLTTGDITKHLVNSTLKEEKGCKYQEFDASALLPNSVKNLIDTASDIYQQQVLDIRARHDSLLKPIQSPNVITKIQEEIRNCILGEEIQAEGMQSGAKALKTATAIRGIITEEVVAGDMGTKYKADHGEISSDEVDDHLLMIEEKKLLLEHKDMKKNTVNTETLHNILLQLQQSCEAYNLDHIAKLVIEISDAYPKFVQDHNGINWNNLARLLDLLSPQYQYNVYKTLPQLIRYALEQNEIKQEISNLGIIIDYVITDPFYKQTDLVTKHLTALIDFVTDIRWLYDLRKYLEVIDINSLEYQITNHNVKSSAILYGLPYHPGEQYTSTKVDDSYSIGRIHHVMMILYIGEITSRFSLQLQKYFSENDLNRIKTLRNMICHPEREDNWIEIKKLISDESVNLDTGILALNLLRSYEIAAEMFHWLAYRIERREEFPEFCLQELFQSESFVYLSQPFVTKEVLWKHIIHDLSSPKVVYFKKTDTLLQKKAKDYLSTQMKHIMSLSFHSIDKQALDLLDTIFQQKTINNTHSTSVSLKDYLTIKYHILLSKEIHSQHELHNILEILSRSSYFDIQKKLPEKTIINKMNAVLKDLNLGGIKKWNHLVKILLVKRLVECNKELEKQSYTLEKYENKYEAARYYKLYLSSEIPNVSEQYEFEILLDYPELLSKYSITRIDYLNIIDSLLYIDDVSQKITDLYVLDRVASITFPRLLLSLEKIVDCESVLNPSLTMCLTQSVNPTYSVIEFFMMIAGSMVRSCFEKSTYYENTILRNMSDEVTMILDDKIITLSEAMDKLQQFRGSIAHANLQKQGATSSFEFFPYRAYIKYATLCQDSIKQLLENQIPNKIEEISNILKVRILNNAQNPYGQGIVNFLKQIPSILNQEVDDSNLNQASVKEFTKQLQIIAELSVTEGKIDNAIKCYQKLYKIYSKISTDQSESLQFALNNLATISLLAGNVEQYLALKFERGAELDHNLIKLTGQDVEVVLAYEQQIIDQVMQQQVASSQQTPTSTEDQPTQLADATPLAGDVLAVEQAEI